jgi:hypothetical protein
MDYTTFLMIATIFFWVLAACAVVTGMVWVFCYVQYYRWDKQDRERNTFIHAVQETVKEAIEQANNANLEIQDDIEDEYADFVM